MVSRGVESGRVKPSRARFPRSTTDNPFGLVKPARRSREGGVPYAPSSGWTSLRTDQDGKEFKDAILANKMEFKTVITAARHSSGHRGTGDQQPNDGYQTNDTDEIGNGITAWISTNGFLHQMKAHGEGTFECWGAVAGVRSNSFKIRVS
jgi:hypothetical protein